MHLFRKLLLLILICLLISSQVFASTVLKKGSSGENVKQLQQMLINTGYYSYKVTGYYGSITTNAVLKYQQSNNLKADGIAGSQTLGKLYSEATHSNTLLKVGSRGSSVSTLQENLKDLGYYSSTVDGIFGSKTKNSVISFQKDFKLKTDGIAGSQTLGKLYSVSSTEETSSFGNVSSSDDEYWLSRIIEAESKGESYEGKIAVGNVVINRVNSNLFPNAIKDVIFQYYKGIPMFTPVQNGAIYNTPSDESVKAAKAVLNGENMVGNATYFNNPNKSTSSWIEKNKNFICRIGNHAFYG